MAPRAPVSTWASKVLGAADDEVDEPPLQADTPAASNATDASEQKDRFMGHGSPLLLMAAWRRAASAWMSSCTPHHWAAIVKTIKAAYEIVEGRLYANHQAA